MYEDDFEKKYMIWVEHLGKIINNKFYNLVISDNLVSPLQFNSNCILFGSFLWHDIVKKLMKIEMFLILKSSCLGKLVQSFMV